MVLTTRDDERREQHHYASGRNEKMEWNEQRETRFWESTLTTNARTELLDYQQRKDKLDVGLWKTSQNYEVTTCHSRKRFDWEQEKIKSFFHRGDKKTWIIGNHHKEQHSQWKALGEIYTKITPMKRLVGWKDDLSEQKMMDLNMSLLKTLWSMNPKGNYPEWHSTTSEDKVERIALWNARWRMLELLKTNMCWAPCLF